MKLTLTFSDCEVASVAQEGETVVIRLSAAHVLQTPAAEGAKPREGFARGVVVSLTGARIEGPVGHLIGHVSQGRVCSGGRWSSAAKLPSTGAGPVELELTFANQSGLTLSGSHIHFGFDGAANFAESLFC